MQKFYHDDKYLGLVLDILNNGIQKGDRTGTGTISVFGRQMRFDLTDGTIPLLTTKKMPIKSIIHELLWFISGNTNIKYLIDNGVKIWDQWANDSGELGPVYPEMWRAYPTTNNSQGIDQLNNIIQMIKNNPNDRRLLVNSWHPALLPDASKSFSENIANGKQALPPCHYSFQFYVVNNEISLKLNMRSNDLFLGNPFNIAQYSILLHMVAQVTNLIPKEFIYDGGDIHIYNNHIKQCNLQLLRDPFPSPKILLNKEIMHIDDFTIDDFELVGYKHHPAIKGDVSI